MDEHGEQLCQKFFVLLLFSFEQLAVLFVLHPCSFSNYGLNLVRQEKGAH